MKGQALKMHKSTGKVESIGEVFHKEKNQKKYNKTRGQYDKLKKYGIDGTKSTGKLATDDKQIRREANYLKNIHIDKCYENLLRMELITNTKYQAWWCGVMHKLGTGFVMAQADLAIKNGRNPAALFHFQINKAINKHEDAFMPRFNRNNSDI
jgi:hypothetical protein